MTVVRYTEQQSRALSLRDSSIALSAGAGCGKTFVLTQRFLGYLDPELFPALAAHPDPLSGIVAITFTDRAAREMRDRIRRATQQRLDQSTPEQRDYWYRILKGLESARISTIHSFAGGLLRTHAVKAGLDPQFETLTGDVQQSMLRRAVQDVVHQALINNDDDVNHLVLRYSLESVQSMLIGLIDQRLRIRFDDFEGLDEAELAGRWLETLKGEYLPAMLSSFRRGSVVRRLITCLESLDNIEHEALQARRSFLLARLKPDVSAGPAELPGIIGPLDQWLSELRDEMNIKLKGKKCEWPSDDQKKQLQKCLELGRKAIDSLMVLTQLTQSDLLEPARLTLMLLRIYQKACRGYQAAKSLRGGLDFDDLLIETRHLLFHYPDIRQQVSKSIRYLLLDEFQDTDPLQMDIVRALCGDDLTTGKLFFVGDSKQSIYRFRRADPTIFHALRNEIPPKGRLPLSVNFRSQPAILNFVNAFFGDLFEDYEPLLPGDPHQHSPLPAIEFLLATPAPSSEQETQPEDPADESDSSDPPVENQAPSGDEDSPDAAARRFREAEWIAARIRQLLSDPTPRIPQRDHSTGEVSLRRAEPGDIVILFAALSNVGLYEHALRDANIDYYLVGGQAFFTQQENYDVVNLLTSIEDDQNDLALLGVLRSPFFNFSDDTLLTLTRTGVRLGVALFDIDLSEITRHHADSDQADRVLFARNVLTDLRRRKDRLPIANLLKAAIDSTGYDGALLLEFLGPRKLANLHKLLDKAREFDARPETTLGHFVAWLTESVEEGFREELATTSPETGNLVRLMTIHQSKGLEFPIVFVADMNRQSGAKKSSALVHPMLGPLTKLPEIRGKRAPHHLLDAYKQLEKIEDDLESLRLLYVAMTRAADHLILSTSWEARAKRISLWMQTLQDKFDLQTGLPIEDPYLGRTRLAHVSPDQIPRVLVHHTRPAILASSKAPSPHLPIAQFESAFFASQPKPFPELSAPIVVDFSSRRSFSVSELEVVATQLQGPRSSEAHSDDHATDEMRSLGSLAPDRFGQLVHLILEKIDLSQPASLENLITRARHQLRFDQENIEVATIQKMIASFLATGTARSIAQAKPLLRELPFSLRWHNHPAAFPAIINGTIDCLYQHEGQWHLVDYKTGRPPNSVEQAIEHYGFQMFVYAHTCQQAFGAWPATIRLCYLTSRVSEFDVKLSPTQRQQYALLLSEAVASLRSSKAIQP